MIYVCRGIGNIYRGACGVVFQATSAGRVARNIDNPPIIVHGVLLGCRRKIGASGKVEYLCFGVPNKNVIAC